MLLETAAGFTANNRAGFELVNAPCQRCDETTYGDAVQPWGGRSPIAVAQWLGSLDPRR